MTSILIHGLGQNAVSWSRTAEILRDSGITVNCPDIFTLGDDLSYKGLSESFRKYCNNTEGRLDLLGLSLGGVLALDLAADLPEKVNSVVIIGTPYYIPKILLGIQNLIFHASPEKTFEQMGISKKDFLRLSESMANIDIPAMAEKVRCPALILCGEKDRANMKSGKLLNGNIKNSRFDIIKGAGHEVNIHSPEELCRMASEFWTGLM